VRDEIALIDAALAANVEFLVGLSWTSPPRSPAPARGAAMRAAAARA
jgi:hypothetical protein